MSTKEPELRISSFKFWIFLWSMTGIVFLGSLNPIFAEDKNERPRRPDRAENRLTMLKERLELTDGQYNEIRAIMESARLEGLRDREKYTKAGDPEGGRKAAMERQKQTEEKIKAVLNDKQKKEFEKINKEMNQRKEKRGGRPDKRPGGLQGRSGGMGRR